MTVEQRNIPVTPEDVQRGDAAIRDMIAAGFYRFMGAMEGYASAVKSGDSRNIRRGSGYEEQERQALARFNDNMQDNNSFPAQIAGYVVNRVVPEITHIVNETTYGQRAQQITDSIEGPLVQAIIFANRQVKKVGGVPQISDIIAGIGKPRGYVKEMRANEKTQQADAAAEHIYPTKVIYTDETGQTYQVDIQLTGGEAGSFIQMGLRVEQQRDGSLVIYGTPADATLLRCYSVIRDNIFSNFDEANQKVTLPISQGPKGTVTEDVDFSVADILEMQQNGYRYDSKKHIFVAGR